jgi:hypothetical protein
MEAGHEIPLVDIANSALGRVHEIDHRLCSIHFRRWCALADCPTDNPIGDIIVIALLQDGSQKRSPLWISGFQVNGLHRHTLNLDRPAGEDSTDHRLIQGHKRLMTDHRHTGTAMGRDTGYQKGYQE